MMEKVKAFWQDEEGMGTLEVLIIVVVLISIALFFKSNIQSWVRDMTNSVNSETKNMTNTKM